MHYRRFRLYGDPLKIKERTPESLSRRIRSRLTLPTDPVRLAYIAGIIDGEGNIGANGEQGKGYKRVVCVANTNTDLMMWLSQFGGSVTPKRGGLASKKQCYVWRITAAEEIRELLLAVRPYLIVKRVACDETLAWVGESRFAA